MLSSTESFFVRLLRGTVIATATLAFFVTIATLSYAAYAYFAPEPTANLSRKIANLRQIIDPANLIKETFPKESSVYNDVSSTPDNVAYQSHAGETDEIFKEFNQFLDIALGAGFDNKEQFSGWLYGNNKIELSWDNSIDDKSATNENNVNILFRSLLLDYAKRLTVRAAPLRQAKNLKLYPTSFDRLTAPTGRAQAPYFVVWFFNALQKELAVTRTELATAKAERQVLRLSALPALAVASAAFGYFIIIMFLFLIVSIEASVRQMASIQTLPDPAKKLE